MEQLWEDNREQLAIATILQLLLIGAVATYLKTRVKETRNPTVAYQRMCWDEYCQTHVARGTFKRRLRMEKESFDILLGYIFQWLLVNEQMANL